MRWVRTTQSRDRSEVFPNLIRDLFTTGIDLVADVETRISCFIKEMDNQKRLHSSPGYLSTNGYEKQSGSHHVPGRAAVDAATSQIGPLEIGTHQSRHAQVRAAY